ncbi:MAG: hypothetical protein JNL58_31695 [Planctomyces sp.]|nr:hypothetical protein [Planctomyces sp.]
MNHTRHTDPQQTLTAFGLRSVLHGQRVLLIGGDPRPGQQRAIASELKLTHFRWMETRRTTSINRLRKIVASEQFDVVIVALRWARYSFSELSHMCRQHGIAFVRLPGGMNPGQIAFQANEQIGRQLVPA